MLESRVRGTVERLVDPIGGMLARVGATPNAITLTGLLVTLSGAGLIGWGRLAFGGIVALAGASLDGLDGAVARSSGRASRRGSLIDSVADRVGETALFSALAFALAEEPILPLLCVLSLGAALIVSYLRAKAESVGADGRGGLMGRAERIVLLSVGLMTGYVGPMLWSMAVLTWITVGHRFSLAWRRLQE